MRILIPQISQKIDKKLQELNLRPFIKPADFIRLTKGKKHRYWSVCQTRKGKKVAFFARLHDNKDASQKFKREVGFLNKIKTQKLDFYQVTPKLIDFGQERDFEWLIREYIDGLPLGFSRKLKTKIPFKIAPKLTKAIFQISQTPKSFLKTIPLKKFDWHYYIKIQNLYFGLVRRGVIKQETYQKIIKLIQARKELLKKENHYFSHGDLNLGNIVLGGNNFKIIDWELVHFNNFVYDFTYCWIHLWQAPKNFRRKFIQTYLGFLSVRQRKVFREILPVVVIYLALGGIVYQSQEVSKHYLLARRKFYLKLLLRALADFEELIKI